jgi:hypothetical protein
MSRAYRIAIKECENRVIRAEDRISTDLELLEVLPADQMAAMLQAELERRGFKKEGDVLVRRDNGVTVSVDPQTGTVTVSAEASEKVDIEVQKEGRAWDDVGPGSKQVKESLKKEAKKDIDRKAQEKTAALQTQVTDRLEGQLNDIRDELDKVVNRVTAEALKQKAAQMGQIKEMTEDADTGNLTIVVEV